MRSGELPAWWPGFLFGFLGAGGRLPKARRGRFFIVQFLFFLERISSCEGRTKVAFTTKPGSLHRPVSSLTSSLEVSLPAGFPAVVRLGALPYSWALCFLCMGVLDTSGSPPTTAVQGSKEAALPVESWRPLSPGRGVQCGVREGVWLRRPPPSHRRAIPSAFVAFSLGNDNDKKWTPPHVQAEGTRVGGSLIRYLSSGTTRRVTQMCPPVATFTSSMATVRLSPGTCVRAGCATYSRSCFNRPAHNYV